MPQVDHVCLEQVRRAWARYEAEVDAALMEVSSKATYIGHARQFVRWLADEFEPGGTLRGRNRQ